MALRKRLGLLLLIALLGSVLSIISAGAASAAGGGGGGGGGTGGGGTGGGGGGGGGGAGGGGGGGGDDPGPPNTGSRNTVSVNGACGDVLTLTALQAGDPITIDIAIPGDSTEVWTYTATDQEYGAVTGGRVGDPIQLAGTALPPLTLNDNGIGLATSGTITDTAGFTHEISYTATRTSPSPMTCTNVAYWTHPTSTAGPTPENPAARPDSAPALTGTNAAHAGTHDVLLQLDQEMLTTGLGVPAPSAFDVVVGGAARTVTAVTITNDVPPGKAMLDLTLSGDALAVGPTLTVAYHASTNAGDPALQDLDGKKTLLFPTTTIPIS